MCFCKVRNLSGSSKERFRKPPAGYESWKDFWEKKMHKKFGKCVNTECTRIAEVGAHVYKAHEEANKKWYIVPFCKTCNNKSNAEFEVPVSSLCPIH